MKLRLVVDVVQRLLHLSRNVCFRSKRKEVIVIKLSHFKNKIGQYWVDKTASMAVLFGVMAPVLIGLAGMSLDLSQAYLVRQRLAQALDAAALAAVASETTEADIRQKVLDFFEVNYPADRLGITFEPTVVVLGDEVRVVGSAQYNTLFLRIIGIDVIDVSADTTVVREVQGIEVVMVLDNTGSMATNNNIGALRDAASNFVYIMYGIDPDDGETADPASLDQLATRDTDLIRVGLVPYSSSVNVGPYGLGRDPNGDFYSPAFVENPFNRPYSTNQNSFDWSSCVIEGDYPLDTQDHEGPWDMYRYCFNDATNRATCDAQFFNGQPFPRRYPNFNCPRTQVVPLSTSPSQLKTSIDTMRAAGHTYGNVGMVWGYRVLSEAFPFEEGESWNNPFWRKAIVMMTDGQNTIHPHYGAYGRTADSDVTPSDQNERFLEVCDALKEEGAIIYTVTFFSNINEATRQFYRECATSEESHFFDAPNQEDLIEVFETISRELSQLHITD